MTTAFDTLEFELMVDDLDNDELIALFRANYVGMGQDGIRAYSDEIERRMGFDAMNAAVFTVCCDIA